MTGRGNIVALKRERDSSNGMQNRDSVWPPSDGK